jgi:N-methylhydantoinase A
MSTYILAVDVGGTFTSTMSIDGEGNINLIKSPTDFKDITAIVIQNIDQLGLNLINVDRIVHSTVVILDSLLHRRVAKTGLITTEGFRDVLEIMRTNRPEALIFDIQQNKPEPLIPRRLRFEVSERLDFQGKILREFDENKAKECVRALNSQGIESVAVCLLHSYANDVHEQRVKGVVKKAMPETFISLSSELAPQWREFERTSTTVQNASTMPIMQKYISSIENRISEYGFKGDLFMMQSNGGMRTAKNIQNKPISTIFSSPVAGVIGASYLAKTMGLQRVITYDHGGSRCFISVIEDGTPTVKEGGSLEQWPILSSMIDIETIQAGANSKVWIDARHMLRIGPEDVGTIPGAACFGMGGNDPSVIDASLLLGYINPEYFMNGQLHLDVNFSREVLKTKIAKFYNMQVNKVALGIQDLLVSIHARGMREVSTKKGYDPRDLTLVAFGGSGGLYASLLARELGIQKVVLPFASSHMSCLGLLVGDIRHDYNRMFVRNLNDVQVEDINQSFNDLEAVAIDELQKDGFSDASIGMVRSAKIRYIGQEYAVDVPVPGNNLTKKKLAAMNNKFSEIHEKLYGYSTPNAPTEVIALQLTALGYLKTPMIQKRKLLKPDNTMDLKDAFKGYRSVIFKNVGKVTDCPTYERMKLFPGSTIKGPAVIEEAYSEILLMPGDKMGIDNHMNVIISVGG